MSIKIRAFLPGALVVFGLLFGVLLAIPASHAQETTTLQPVEDRDVPEGSQIPEWRIQETETKVREYKAKMRAQQLQQQQEQAPQEAQPKPEGGQQ